MSQVEDVVKPKAAYMVNSYLEWAQGEGIPIVEDFAVDLGTAETDVWPRLDARGGIFNLKGRGVIEVDAFADVIAFDPNVFAERATLENPNQPATGMEHVIVNGVVTRRDGYDTGAHGGIVLRRKEQLG